jgi:hypothetical protein
VSFPSAQGAAYLPACLVPETTDNTSITFSTGMCTLNAVSASAAPARSLSSHVINRTSLILSNQPIVTKLQATSRHVSVLAGHHLLLRNFGPYMTIFMNVCVV